MSAGTVKPTDAKVFVNGGTVALVCHYCGFKQVYIGGMPVTWDMSHLCKRDDGIWLVIGQEEIQVK